MKNVTFIASKELLIQTESGEVVYPKGSVVHFEQDEKGDLFLSYHQMREDKVEEFEININSKTIVEAILNNCIIAEQELDDTITFQEVSLDSLI